jgi:probable F420-dependent oxidoreductase
MANHGWDLQQYSRGRFVIGLGTQVKGHNERRFSVPWGPPSPRLREYVECMRHIWHTWQTGEKPGYEGKYYRYNLDAWNWNPGPSEYPPPKVVLAAVKERNTRIAAEVADGVLWHGMMSFQYRDKILLPEFIEGARRAGKDPKDLVICGGGFVITARDEEKLALQMAEQKRWMSFYASTRTYQDSMRMAGLEDEAARLHRLSIDQQWEEMIKVISDDFLEQYAVVATWDQLPAKLRERYGGINTEISFRADLETPEDEEQIRETIARIRQIPSYGEIERAAVPA